MKKLLCALGLLAVVVMAAVGLGRQAVAQSASTSGTCTGHFVNPISDLCWDCVFPITIGSFPLLPSNRPDTPNPALPICMCPMPLPPFIRLGLAVGYWEPARLADVTRHPYCFVNLGGFTLGNIPAPAGKTVSKDGNSHDAAWHIHWYVYPVLYWLEILVDWICLEAASVDIAYITELDPLWLDDELTFLINPEAVLFANPIAIAACAADCVAASVGMPLDPLFWCAGCQGSYYPLDGRLPNHVGSIQSSLLAAERFIYKLHRELVLWAEGGPEAICGKYPMPVVRKSLYRSQITNPVPGPWGLFGCNPLGRSTVLYETGREVPVIGEDFGFLFWRKRNCCSF